MKVLRINNNKGDYSVNGKDYHNISEIRKEDILLILTLILNDDDNELTFDLMDETNQILNNAEKIIYEKIYKKLNDVKKDKEKIIEQILKEIDPILTKYNINLADDEKTHKTFYEAKTEKSLNKVN